MTHGNGKTVTRAGPHSPFRLIEGGTSSKAMIAD
jgi:hypothetical protein